MVSTLSSSFEEMLRAVLPTNRDLAADVLSLSDFYHAHAGLPTPWDEPFTTAAYLAYFLPLNYARLRSVWREVERCQLKPQSIWDFGSGVGTTQWMLEDQTNLAPVPLFAVERSRAAIDLNLRLQSARQGQWRALLQAPARPANGAMAVFSYSFLEMRSQLPRLQEFDHLLIVEPSTRDCGRQLMEWRARFLAQGWSVLAPCTHMHTCPLLQHSTRDWCHMRVPFHAPAWWLELEDRLPMKNRTLTYSYLLLSRTTSAASPAIERARVIGDTLNERGKTRQMICRGPEREFLSWLHRNGTPQSIPHGSLILDLLGVERKSSELRLPKGLTLPIADCRLRIAVAKNPVLGH